MAIQEINENIIELAIDACSRARTDRDCGQRSRGTQSKELARGPLPEGAQDVSGGAGRVDRVVAEKERREICD